MRSNGRFSQAWSHMFIYTPTHELTYTHKHTHTYACKYTQTCKCTQTHIYAHKYTQAPKHTHTQTCIILAGATLSLVQESHKIIYMLHEAWESFQFVPSLVFGILQNTYLLQPSIRSVLHLHHRSFLYHPLEKQTRRLSCS